ncbi:MAG: ribbon-helix-helix domain-containing protein [Alphaproteobacteria bacterium]|nr:ribbon-helix-helix domain-containing protein [Alphaproteobacteria bacterium]
MPTSLIKRSVVISGHATSVTLEAEFWEALREIAVVDGLSIAALIRQVDKDIPVPRSHNLSSALRVFILKRIQQRS